MHQYLNCSQKDERLCGRKASLFPESLHSLVTLAAGLSGCFFLFWQPCTQQTGREEACQHTHCAPWIDLYFPPLIRISQLSSSYSPKYFLGQRFCVLCIEICTPSLFTPSPLCGASFRTSLVYPINTSTLYRIQFTQQSLHNEVLRHWKSKEKYLPRLCPR